MLLLPIHFEEAKDVITFLETLEKSGAIEIRKQDLKPQIIVKEKHHLLKGNDGNIYFLKDILNYLEQASSEDLATSKITFPSAKGPISLKQLKDDFSIAEHLMGFQEGWSYIEKWNLNIYSELQLPSLTTTEEIKRARSIYDNSKLYALINTTMFGLTVQETILSSAQALLLLVNQTPLQVPLPNSAADFISTLSKDFLKATAIQENKIKHHLLNEIKKTTNQDDVEELTKWVKAIDDNNAKIQEVLKKLKQLLKNHRDVIDKAKAHYTQLMEEGVTVEERTKKLEMLNTESAALRESIIQQENMLNWLKPVAVYGIFTLVPFLVAFIITFVTISLATPFVALFILSTVLFSMTAASLLLLTPWGDKIADGIVSVKRSIEDKVDSFADGKRAELRAVATQIAEVGADLYFLQTYVDENFRGVDRGHNALINALEADLQEMDTFEKSLKKMRQEPVLSSHPVSPISMFNRTREQPASSPVSTAPEYSPM
ncbi:hypothetical protein [Legionella cardiaca]|uniref:Uncharacterized protein n=1 Tax=Legionella cardiaca TaxID=1071983 RepID=A0ABY8AR36_9GAMM|nr:hypothetical protein [Legionella cardiaca]WED42686.1 hypothetical protein PXX05_12380 [Legionella cardiaca]